MLPWFSLTVGTDSKAVHSMGREVPVGPLRRGRAAASLLPWLETATGPNRLHLPSLAPAPAVAPVRMLRLGLSTLQSPPEAPAVSVARPPPLAGHSRIYGSWGSRSIALASPNISRCSYYTAGRRCNLLQPCTDRAARGDPRCVGVGLPSKEAAIPSG